jgi:hypothetical protein
MGSPFQVMDSPKSTMIKTSPINHPLGARVATFAQNIEWWNGIKPPPTNEGNTLRITNTMRPATSTAAPEVLQNARFLDGGDGKLCSACRDDTTAGNMNTTGNISDDDDDNDSPTHAKLRATNPMDISPTQST